KDLLQWGHVPQPSGRSTAPAKSHLFSPTVNGNSTGRSKIWPPRRCQAAAWMLVASQLGKQLLGVFLDGELVAVLEVRFPVLRVLDLEEVDTRLGRVADDLRGIPLGAVGGLHQVQRPVAGALVE